LQLQPRPLSSQKAHGPSGFRLVAEEDATLWKDGVRGAFIVFGIKRTKHSQE